MGGGGASAGAPPRLACLDALHTAARSAARGEPLPQVRARALRAAPPGTVLTITRTPDSTHLTLTAPFRPPSRLPLPVLIFHLTAETPTEPTLPEAPSPAIFPVSPSLRGAS